mmetsp:Transcript_27480/g.20639  ORF Transcript_27480/g.20639 Transcript_27480/m.20639 type:complete len:191 (+) Transcript_27480:110-682(+)
MKDKTESEEMKEISFKAVNKNDFVNYELEIQLDDEINKIVQRYSNRIYKIYKNFQQDFYEFDPMTQLGRINKFKLIQASQLEIKLTDLKQWLEKAETETLDHNGITLKAMHRFDENNLLLECKYEIGDDHNSFTLLFSFLRQEDRMFLCLLPFDEEQGSIIPSSFLILGQPLSRQPRHKNESFTPTLSPN